MGFWKGVPDERRSLGDRQHHPRTVDRDIPCQVAPLQSLTPFLPALSVSRLLFVATNKHWTLEPCLENLPRMLQSDEPSLLSLKGFFLVCRRTRLAPAMLFDSEGQRCFWSFAIGLAARNNGRRLSQPLPAATKFNGSRVPVCDPARIRIRVGPVFAGHKASKGNG